MITYDDREVMDSLNRMMAAATNPAPWLSAIGNAVVDNTRLRFSEGRAPDGTPWHPLSMTTIARRRQGSAQPLLDTGRLRNSITQRREGFAVIVGTNTRYGRMQQFGAKKGAFGRTRRGAPIPWGDVPGRPYLGISGEDRAEILAILERSDLNDKGRRA